MNSDELSETGIGNSYTTSKSKNDSVDVDSIEGRTAILEKAGGGAPEEELSNVTDGDDGEMKSQAIGSSSTDNELDRESKRARMDVDED